MGSQRTVDVAAIAEAADVEDAWALRDVLEHALIRVAHELVRDHLRLEHDLVVTQGRASHGGEARERRGRAGR